jgi:hypothetical protein
MDISAKISKRGTDKKGNVRRGICMIGRGGKVVFEFLYK